MPFDNLRDQFWDGIVLILSLGTENNNKKVLLMIYNIVESLPLTKPLQTPLSLIFFFNCFEDYLFDFSEASNSLENFFPKDIPIVWRSLCFFFSKIVLRVICFLFSKIFLLFYGLFFLFKKKNLVL